MEVTVKVRIAWLLTLLFWIVAACMAIPFLLYVFEYTTLEFFDSTESQAFSSFSNEFPQYNSMGSITIGIKSNNGPISKEYIGKVTKLVERSLDEGGWREGILKVAGYSIFSNLGAENLADIYISDDESMSIINIFTNRTYKDSFNLLITQFMTNEIKAYDTAGGNYTLYATSSSAMIQSSKDSSYKTYMYVLAISFPLITVIVALATSSTIFVVSTMVSLVIGGVISIVVSVCALGGTGFSVSVYSPALFLATSMLTGGWCALVVTNNFGRYLTRGFDNTRAALLATSSSLNPLGLWWVCHFCWTLGMAIFCEKAVFSNALGLGITVTISTVVPLTFLPSLFGSLGSFFTISGIVPCIESCRARRLVDDCEEVNKIRNSFLAYFYIRLYQRPVTCGCTVLLCLAVLYAFTGATVKFSITPSESRLFPTGTESFKGYQEIASKFPASIITPVFAMFSANGAQGDTNIFNESNFVYNYEYTQKFMTRYKSLTSVTQRSIISLSYLGGYSYGWKKANQLLEEDSAEGRSYREICKHIVNEANDTTVTLIDTNKDPGSVSPYVVPQLRALGAAQTEATGHKVDVFGTPVILYDNWRSCTRNLGYATIVSAIAILFVFSIVTKAPCALVRIAITGLLNLACAMGCYVAFARRGGAVSFVTASLAYPSLMSLAFALETNAYAVITWYRVLGFDPKSSEIRGMYDRRYLALAEPLIALAAFIPLLCSTSPILFEVGVLHLLLCVVNLVFVKYAFSPALSLLWGNMNWAPESYAIIYTQPTRPHEGAEAVIIKYADQVSINDDDDDD